MAHLEEQNGAVLTITPTDRLDSFTASDFELYLVQKIEEGAQSIIVDCHKLDYINSAGLKAFLRAAKLLESSKGRLVLCGLASNVHMVFELTGLHKLFTIKADRAEAQACFT